MAGLRRGGAVSTVMTDQITAVDVTGVGTRLGRAIRPVLGLR